MDLSRFILLVGLSTFCRFAAPTFSQPVFEEVDLPSTAYIPLPIYFTGLVKDVEGLKELAIEVSGPVNDRKIAFVEQLSGLSRHLSNYYFDGGNPTYANVPGVYTIALVVTNTRGLRASISFKVTVVPAINPPKFDNDLEFEQLAQEVGLSHNAVYCIFQDRRGFIWFGTANGLNRYDGYSFKKYYHDPRDDTSLSNNWVWSIFEDYAGILWVGTVDGLNKYNAASETFFHYKHDSSDPKSLSYSYVRVIYEDRARTLWIGTTSGLNKFDRKGEDFLHYNQDLTNPEDMASDYILSIHEDSSNRIWVGTGDGLYYFNEEAQDLVRFENWDELFAWEVAVTSIVEVRSDALLLGSWSQSAGLSRLFIASGQRETLLNGNMQVVYEDRNGLVWVGASRIGLVRYDPTIGSLSAYKFQSDNPQSISSNEVKAVYQDRSGTIWVGTTGGGVNRMVNDENGFRNYNFDTDTLDRVTSDNNVSAIVIDKADELWVGSLGGSLSQIHRKTNERTWYEDLPKVILTIFCDQNGMVWVGAGYGGGLYKYSRDFDQFEYFRMDPDQPYSSNDNHVTSIYEDGNGQMWFGTHGGLYLLKSNGDGFTKYEYAENDSNSISSNKISGILEDSFGNFWIGTWSAGLNLFDRESGRFVHYRHRENDPNSLSDNRVQALYEAPAGTLWIGTHSGGLNKFNFGSKTFGYYTTADGLASNNVQGILGDESGNLWISTDNGLSKLNLKTGIFRNFDVTDGLPSNEFNERACYKSPTGELFWGTKNGLTAFSPDSLRDNPFIPPVVLTDFQINNEPASLDTIISEIKHIRLPYDQNFISFQFAALNYTASEKNQYRYKLDGLDEDWIDSGTRRFASYTNLDPGDYVFRVLGSNNDRVWNEEGTSVRITITPPPWQTWWAYTSYVLFIVGSLVAVRRYDLTRQRLKMDREKLQELDRTKSRFFANISHEFRTPLTLILGPLQALMDGGIKGDVKGQYQVMERSARRLLRLINQLLDLSRLEAGKLNLRAKETNFVSFLRGLVFSFESLAKQNNITLNFETDLGEKESQVLLVYIDHDKIEKVMTNLLSNAFKFTPQRGRISVVVSENGGFAEVVIEDTGAGISVEALPHIFDRFYQAGENYRKDQQGSGIGLALTKEFVELHQGQIQVASDLGKGTQFRVRLPLGREHLTAEQIIETDSQKILATSEQASFASAAGVEVGHGNDSPEMSGGEDAAKPSDEDKVDAENTTIVLVVEDNDDMRRYIRDQLAHRFQVIESADGRQGFERAVAEIPDLVISDVMMPEMDGYELCQKLKSDERTSHVPVILLTAKSSGESKIEGLELGADDYLIKPFDSKELQTRVVNLIDQRRKLRERWTRVVKLEPKEIAISSADEIFLQRTMEIINGELDKSVNEKTPDFTVEGLAERVGMSRVQLHRKLKALTDQSATDFVRSLRLQRAASLLDANYDNVSRVAYAVGFENLSYFTKVFKEQFGMLPSEYRSQSFQRDS